MIRVLLMITVAGFVLCVGALSAAVAIGGPEAIARGGWHVASGRWGDHWDWRWADDDHHWDRQAGRAETRTLPWSGASRLDLGLAANVRYVQSADGPGVVEVTGPSRAIEDVVVRGDRITYERRRHRHHRKLDIVIRAPAISSFDLSGANTLQIEGYRQARLRLDISGSAEVTAQGEADEIALDLSGSSDVDLGDLRTKGAEVDISGGADAIIAPTDWAKLDISGAGDVSLLTNPARLETDISGAGSVRRVERAAPSPSSPPSASPTPAPQSSKL